MWNQYDDFMRVIVFEVIENELYYYEARLLTESEKRLIIEIYNELGLNATPSVSDLKMVWDNFWEQISQ